MKTIKLQHPNITATWLKAKPGRNILIVETNLSMPDRREGFLDERFSDLMCYLAKETQAYRDENMDIEIRQESGAPYMRGSRTVH